MISQLVNLKRKLNLEVNTNINVKIMNANMISSINITRRIKNIINDYG